VEEYQKNAGTDKDDQPLWRVWESNYCARIDAEWIELRHMSIIQQTAIPGLTTHSCGQKMRLSSVANGLGKLS
jgi:hypothetical protein